MMNRTLVCICLILLAASFIAAHADLGFNHNFSIDIQPSENTFLSSRFCITSPDVTPTGVTPVFSGLSSHPADEDKGLDRINASFQLFLPRGIGLAFHRSEDRTDLYDVQKKFNASQSFSIMATCETPSGVVFAKAQKYLQEYAAQKNIPALPLEKTRAQPVDIYAMGFKTAIGLLNIFPQIAYASETPGYGGFDEAPAAATQLMVAVSGEMDHLGFETELAYQKGLVSATVPDTENRFNNAHLYGIYGNLWTRMKMTRIGLLFAYGSWDDRTRRGYDFYDAHDRSLLSHQNAPMLIENAGLNPWGDGLSGLVLGRVYGEVAMGPRFSLMPSLTYLTDHVEGVDAVGLEINLAADYSLTDILTYSAAVAFARTETISDLADAETSQDYKILQKLQLKF